MADVRKRYTKSPDAYQAFFDRITALSHQAREAIRKGNTITLGHILNANHEVLRQIRVSSPELDRLVVAATEAGALGAKLSGGGVGGNMIALVEPSTIVTVSAALTAAGATRVIHTQVI